MEIRQFMYQEHDLQAIDLEGVFWFEANQLCEVLNYANSRKAIGDHVDPDDVQKLDITDSIGRKQKANFVNESGLYALIFGSEKEEARAFKRWVTSEVLPTLRKQGGYISPDANSHQLEAMQVQINALVATLDKERTNRTTLIADELERLDTRRPKGLKHWILDYAAVAEERNEAELLRRGHEVRADTLEMIVAEISTRLAGKHSTKEDVLEELNALMKKRARVLRDLTSEYGTFVPKTVRDLRDY